MTESCSTKAVPLPLVRLMQLVSPALPIGAYAYSQGLEYAIDSGMLADEASIVDWIGGVYQHSIGGLDLPVLYRCYLAWQKGDVAAVNHWNDVLRAFRETRELLLEDEQLGIALQRLLCSLESESETPSLSATPSFVTQFAYAGALWHIPIDELLAGFSWSWLENQIAAAIKLLPLGQTRAQHCLVALSEAIPDVCQQAKTLTDDELGNGLPGLAMASANHEKQYSRLFRS